MISVALARQLHTAGLPWDPQPGDTFIVPDAGLDGQLFVISEQSAFVHRINGVTMIVFHGSTEWALDHVVAAEVIWLPTESQLRVLLSQRVPPPGELRLVRSEGNYTCTIGGRADLTSFTAPSAEDAYGMALLSQLAGSN